MKPKVLIGPAPMRDIPEAYAPILEPHFELVYPKRKAQMTEAELLEQLPGCIASLAGSEPYTAQVLEMAAKAGLKVLGRAGVGYDGVDLVSATQLGIAVTYAPGSNHEAVSEHALMLMLALSKKLFMQHEQILAGQWPRIAQQPLRTRTLGIVGLGRTGSAVAARAKAFGMKILACDPYIDPAWANSQQIPLMPLEALLPQVDILSLHVPLTEETQEFINASRLSLLKPSAFVINTARGEIIEDAALVAALQSGRIAGAGLDVFHVEPPANNPLIGLDNVIVTAHTAGVDVQSRIDMAKFAAEGIHSILVEKRWPGERMVNPDVRAAWPELQD